MAQTIRNIQDVHSEISEEAASIANAAAKRSGLLPMGAYGIFKPRRRKIGLATNELIHDPETLEKLQAIARDALQQALVERPDLTVGLIVGTARNGQNYFDRYS